MQLEKKSYSYLKNRVSRSCNSPVDTRRKLNVHKTLRRRPGRLLNVLCTFKLRLVSTGSFPLVNCCMVLATEEYFFIAS